MVPDREYILLRLGPALEKVLTLLDRYWRTEQMDNTVLLHILLANATFDIENYLMF